MCGADQSRRRVLQKWSKHGPNQVKLKLYPQLKGGEAPEPVERGRERSEVVVRKAERLQRPELAEGLRERRDAWCRPPPKEGKDANESSAIAPRECGVKIKEE